MSLFCHRLRSGVQRLLASVSDAARLLHFSDPVLRAGTAVGLCRRQPGRRSAVVLSQARSAPLRDARTGDGYEGRSGLRSGAELFRAANMPALPRTRVFHPDSGACAHDGSGSCSWRVHAYSRSLARTGGSIFSPQPRARWARPSGFKPKLIKIALKTIPR
jgi:hypothetical protein